MKLQTISLLPLFLVYIYINGFVREAQATCTLDRMKLFAIEACEHLFRDDGGRDKRSYKHNEIFDSNSDKFAHKKHYVRRGNYPKYGYLKLDHFHFSKLSSVDVIPRYKSRKMYEILGDHKEHSKHGNRYKRAHLPHYNNIPYCCLNKCEEDFFC